MFTKKNNILKNKDILPIAIVHVCLIICTHYSGKLSPTLWILKLLNIN